MLTKFKPSLSMALIVLSFILSSIMTADNRAEAEKKAANDNDAVIFGDAGERYPITGTGGIKVTGGHKGIFESNWKTSSIEIDGSGVTAHNFTATNETGDFTAAANGAFFVDQSATCTLSPADAAAGQELIVCNATAGGTVTYKAAAGETLGGSVNATLVNSTAGKVDRFISDGKSWYHE
jgi:hypothetical protein